MLRAIYVLIWVCVVAGQRARDVFTGRSLSLLVGTGLCLLVLAVIGLAIRRRSPRPGVWWTDSRLRIVVLLSAIVAVLGIVAARRGSDFDREFLTELKKEPEFRPALVDYPLRKTLYQRSRAAFMNGDWDAASIAFRSVIRSEVAIYGDDAHIVAYWRAFLAVEERLQKTPYACAAYVQKPAANYAYPEAEAEVRELVAAMAALAQDGANRLLSRPLPPWIDPSQAEWEAVWQASRQGPDLVSGAEDYAILYDGDPALQCRSYLKWIRNTLALDPARAAHAFRIIMMMDQADSRDSVYHSNWVEGVDVEGTGFACPEPGTRFVLSIRNPAGHFIVQSVLSQRGIECRLHSTALGTYGLIGGMVVNDAGRLAAKSIARLWPLAVGREIETAEPSRAGKGLIHNIYTVTGVGWYRVGSRDVLGYEIEDAVWVEATGQRYILKFVWSPELRWNIRQRVEWVSGAYPSTVNWDVLWMIPAPAPNGPALTPPRSASGPGSPPR